MSIEKRIVEAPYMTSALRREAAEEITRLRNALAQSVKIGAEHREGRLKALEWMAALESRLREIGDLAASCRTGPALREAMAQIETMTDMRHNARVQAGTTAPQPDPERDQAARRGASPGTKC